MAYMNDDGSACFEVTTDDYHPRLFSEGRGSAAWIASTNTAMDFLRRQHAGEFRLRLVLREAVDLKALPKRDLLRLSHYDIGPDVFLTEVEVVIEMKNRRRYLVPKSLGSQDSGEPQRVIPLGYNAKGLARQ